jgi:predicted  nucleic acid-binding Zn-ribbon protein
MVVAKSDIIALDGRLDTAESDINVLESDMTVAKSDIIALDGRLDTAESDINVLESDMTVAKSDIVVAKSDIVVAKSDIIALDGRLDTAESDINVLESDMVVAKSDIIALDGRLDTAESDINVVESDMVVAKSDIVALDGRLDTAESDITVLQGSFNKVFVTLTSGGVTAGDIVYVDSDGKAVPADADAEASCTSVVGIADATVADGNPVKVQVAGKRAIKNASFGGNIGKRVYVSGTAGEATLTAPEAVNSVIFLIGHSISATEVIIQPNLIAVND